MQFLEHRRVLIADSPDCPLGHMAIRLTRLGIEPIYSNDLDEALLLAVQESPRVEALAFPAALSLSDIDHMIKQVASRAGIGPEAMIPVGPIPDAEIVRAFRERKFCWAIWEPYHDADLRFVLSNVMLRDEDFDLRLEQRVPGHGVQARLFEGSQGSDVDVIDLSAGGVFLATEQPLPADSRVNLELDVASSSIRMEGKVRWVRLDYRGDRDDMRVGMGVEFGPTNPERGDALRRFVQERMARYVVTPAAVVC